MRKYRNKSLQAGKHPAYDGKSIFIDLAKMLLTWENKKYPCLLVLVCTQLHEVRSLATKLR